MVALLILVAAAAVFMVLAFRQLSVVVAPIQVLVELLAVDMAVAAAIIAHVVVLQAAAAAIVVVHQALATAQQVEAVVLIM
jgi:hypothetical protein